jgi:hypothetical protein
LMELPDWLGAYADPDIRERLLPPYFGATGRMIEALGKNVMLTIGRRSRLKRT